MKKISGVYCIRNLITNELYIGSSKDVKRRWYSHRDKREWQKAPNVPLYKAFQAYGVENFRFEILEETEESNLRELEQEMIEKLNPEYNVRRAVKAKYYKYKGNKFGTETGDRKAYVKAYQSQMCNYNGEDVRLNTLTARFRKMGIEKPFLEAKKYLKK